MLSNNFMATVKSTIGTCQALGVLIENKEIKEILEEIAKGKYAEEIAAQKTDVDPEKQKNLNDYFANIAAEQEAVKEAEEAEKAAEEEKKAETTTETPNEEKKE